MPMTKAAHFLGHHADVGVGGVLGLLGSLGITTGATPMPDGVPAWVGYLATLGVALAPLAIKALAGWRKGEAAGDRVRAARLRAKADRLRKEGKAEEASKLEDQADELEAQAAEKEAKARGGVE